MVMNLNVCVLLNISSGQQKAPIFLLMENKFIVIVMYAWQN